MAINAFGSKTIDEKKTRQRTVKKYKKSHMDNHVAQF